MIVTYEYKGRVSDIEVDALVRSMETFSASVTEKRVEKGSNVNDHVRQNPDRISVEAKVSNTPIKVPQTQMRGATGSYQSVEVQYQTLERPNLGIVAAFAQPTPASAAVNMLKFDAEFDRIRDVHDELKLIKENGLTCSIRLTYRGGTQDYEDMIIVSLGEPREATDGSARSFNIDFQKVVIVETRKVKLSKKATKKKGDKGKKQAKDTNNDDRKRSIAAAALKRWAPDTASSLGIK